jgi:hypothetical protein
MTKPKGAGREIKAYAAGASGSKAGGLIKNGNYEPCREQSENSQAINNFANASLNLMLPKEFQEEPIWV